MNHKLVIIGGGFAGLNLATNVKSNKFQITLVDKNNYIFFPPLLYQVATGFLEPSSISYPYRKMLRNKRNINFKLGEVLKVLLEQNKIILTTGELEYDYLVIATGTETNFFGMENVKMKSIPMKTINDAIEMRNFILNQLEVATTLIADKEKLLRKLNIVVAGGGPTGVEISGLLAEMHSSVLRKDYPELNNTGVQSNIYLVDGAAQLLTAMSKKSQDDTCDELTKLGVKIILNAQVNDYNDDKVYLSNGQIIESENLIWAAGVISQVFDGIPKECYGRGKRLITDSYNKVEGLTNIYAIGDTSIQTTDIIFPNGHPQVAQVALQQGKNLANNFTRIVDNLTLSPFNYNDKGSMAIIGRNKAVADFSSKLHFNGFIAWFMWIFIHLFSLVHYRNKVITFFNWVTAYFTKDQALRMIIRPKEKKN